jgi:hypothetical protein
MPSRYPYAERMMQHFSVMYGNQKVKAMYMEDDNGIMAANEAWETFLRKTKPEVIRKVIDNLPSLGRDWPPSLSEFMGMCRDFDRVEQRQTVSLPAPKHVTDEGKAILKQMKEMLESKKVRL